MGYDKFLISPLTSGMQTNKKPFLIPDDAYEQLNNVYLWRDRLRKRFGSQLMNTQNIATNIQPLFSRLRINIGLTGGAITIPAGMNQLQIGQMFSIGADMFTIWQLGPNVTTLSTNNAATATIDSTLPTNTVVFTGEAGGQTVFWYPSLPVMGLPQWEDVNLLYQPAYAFDTQFAYIYNGGWSRLGTASWTGQNYQLFWVESYPGQFQYQTYLWATNNNTVVVAGNLTAPDGIKYYNQYAIMPDWVTLTPPVLNDNGDTLQTCKLLIQYQDRLLALGPTIQLGGAGPLKQFTNQINWSVDGDASNTNPNAWNSDIPGKGGGYLVAPVQEDIIFAKILKNRLIVVFETQTWEFVFTGNKIQPFRWQSINIELGSDSTFSIVPFDRFIFFSGNEGIQSCNGINVKRIDDLIPDQVLQINNNNNGVLRVYGIRDYHFELVYWTYPDFTANPIFPNRVLVYNYKNNTWAINDDSITCFGYFLNQPDDTWQNDFQTWEDDDTTWESGFQQSKTTQILAGNQEGFVFVVNGNFNTNAPSLQITNITAVDNYTALVVAQDHNLIQGYYVQILNCTGMTCFNPNTNPAIPMTSTNSGIYQVFNVTQHTFNIILDPFDAMGNPQVITGVYTGAGTLSLVSDINILTKQYNFYMDQARNAFIAKVDFNVDVTVAGQITVDTYVSSAGYSLLSEGQITGSLVGTGVLETSPYPNTSESGQERAWHGLYFQAEGECVQLNLYFTDSQIRNSDISSSDFQINAMVFWCLKTRESFTYG